MGVEVLLICVKTKKASVKHSRRRNFFVFFAVFPILMYTNDFETVVLLLFTFMYSSKLQVAAEEFDIFLGD